ncbi:MAG TPA: RNA polymerase sigma factor [Xanthobacteraceae bacterium]|nr:RNA polymerase sigma factor [Xanthobacteraceae bacterium]
MDPAGQDASASAPFGAEALEQLLVRLRPRLHRYAARMLGSVIDGEDVVQEASIKAIEAVEGSAAIANPGAWLFQIVHNTALDLLRRRARQPKLGGDEELAMVSDPLDEVHQREAAAAGLHFFMRLPVAQRSSVILMDVLGYSLDEVGGITGASLPAVKASLHRGRERLRAVLREPDDRPPPTMSPAERARLEAYVGRFNARDFEALRDMLAEDVQVDLVTRTRLKGRAEVSGRYFGNYARADDWHFAPGFVDRRPALIASDPRDPAGRPTYFMLLEWTADQVARIRDFRHASYVIDGAEVLGA